MATPLTSETASVAVLADHRQEYLRRALDNMGWSPDEIERKYGDDNPAQPESAAPEQTGVPAARAPHKATRYLGGRATNEGFENELDPFMNGTIAPTAEELEATARPDSEARLIGEAKLLAAAKHAVERRAIEQGQTHQLPALQLARLARRAQRLGIPVEVLRAREEELENRIKHLS